MARGVAARGVRVPCLGLGGLPGLSRFTALRPGGEGRCDARAGGRARRRGGGVGLGLVPIVVFTAGPVEVYSSLSGGRRRGAAAGRALLFC